jgi:hypothetical protein
VERKRRRGHVEPLADDAGGKTRRPGLDEQAKECEARFLRERGQLPDSSCMSIRFHTSNNIEMLSNVKRRCAAMTTKPDTEAGIDLRTDAKVE